MSPVRVSLEDRLLAVLTEHGPLTTGRLRRLTGPHYQTTRVTHGRQTVTKPRRTGLASRNGWESCPTCRCIQKPRAAGSKGNTTGPHRPATPRKKRTGHAGQVSSAQQLRR